MILRFSKPRRHSRRRASTGELATEHWIGMALHMAGSPVTLFSSVHCAAATENPEKEYFAPTPEWSEERGWDRLWSRATPRPDALPRA